MLPAQRVGLPGNYRANHDAGANLSPGDLGIDDVIRYHGNAGVAELD